MGNRGREISILPKLTSFIRAEQASDPRACALLCDIRFDDYMGQLGNGMKRKVIWENVASASQMKE